MFMWGKASEGTSWDRLWRIFRLWSWVPFLKGSTSRRGAAGPGEVRSWFYRIPAREEGYSQGALGAPPQALI